MIVLQKQNKEFTDQLTFILKETDYSSKVVAAKKGESCNNAKTSSIVVTNLFSK